MEITVREGVSTLEHWIQLDFFSRRHRDILQLHCRDRTSEQNYFFFFPKPELCLLKPNHKHSTVPRFHNFTMKAEEM